MKRMSSQFTHRYIVDAVKYAGGAEAFSALHDISVGHVKAVIDPQRKLKPGPRMMAALGLTEIEPRVYVLGRARK